MLRATRARMAEKPPLPKISVNRKAELLIKQANEAIQLVIAKETPNLNNINLLQYVTAYVISEKLGKTPKLPKTKSNKRQQPKRKPHPTTTLKSCFPDPSSHSRNLITTGAEAQKTSDSIFKLFG